MNPSSVADVDAAVDGAGVEVESEEPNPRVDKIAATVEVTVVVVVEGSW